MRISFLIFLIFLPTGCSDGYIEGQNRFGFAMDLPDNWWALPDRQKDSLPGMIEKASEEDLPPQIAKQFKQQMKAGKSEFYFRKSNGSSDFVDSVNIQLSTYSLPVTDEDLQKVRDMWPVELEKKFGRPMELLACRYDEVGGRKALYLEFDDSSAGTKCMQYQVRKARRETILITATCSNRTLAEVRGEFEGMIASVRFP